MLSLQLIKSNVEKVKLNKNSFEEKKTVKREAMKVVH